MSEMTVDSASIINGMPSAGPHIVTAQVDLSDSYPTGGYALSLVNAAITGKPGYAYVSCELTEAMASGRGVLLDRANQKLIVVDSAGAEIANTTDLSGQTNLVLTLTAI